MLTQDYLSLRLVRLKPGEEWTEHGPGLCFVFPKGGAGRYQSAQVTQRLAPGDVLVLEEASGGTLGAAARDELVFWCFSLSVEHLFPLFASEEICLLQSVLDQFKPIKLYPASASVAGECHRLLATVPPQFSLDHRGQLLRVAAAILSAEFKNTRSQRPGFVRADDHMVQVFEKLSVAELLKLSVAELAERFGCSRRHLSRLFHHHFGVSVATLRMEMRLSKAVSLLRDPDSKVIRVAEDCGFNHLGLFNTCFKRRFGVSPGQWRKRRPPPAGPAEDLISTDSNCLMRLNGLCPWIGKSNLPHSAAPAVSPKSAKSTRPPKQNPALSSQVQEQPIGENCQPPAPLRMNP